MSTLHIFDFDDTLIKSDSKVIIHYPDNSTKEMTSEEYASYVPERGVTQDFSNFDTLPKNPEIIEPVFRELKLSISSDGPDNVVILTARSNPFPVYLFLQRHNIEDIDVIAVGDSNPMAKSRYILERIKDSAIEHVRVFEDNARNIRTIKKVMSESGVTLKTNRVKNGKL